MQNKLRNRCGILSARLQLSVFSTLTLATLTVTNGQQVLIAPPTIPAEPQATEQTGDTNQVAGGSGAVSVSSGAILHNKNPFQWGPVVLHPHLGYGFNYSTGLQSQPGQASKSVVNTLSPGIGLDLGQHWVLGYTAGATFYSDPKFKNTVDHNISLAGHTTYEDWGFNLSQSVAISSDPIVETAQQTDQQTYSTSFGTSYQITSDLSAELTAGQELHSSQGTSKVITNSIGSSSDWSLSGALNYQLGPGVSTGLGVGFGYSKVGIGSDMTYENVNGQFNWQFARKFSLSVNGGLQIRQFLGSGQSSLISPSFGVGLNYHPFDFTAISLSASRGISPSFFQNQVTESTSVNLGVSQRLFRHYYLSLNGGYGLTSYQDAIPGNTTVFHGREDTRSFFGANLSTSFLKRGTASLSYSKSQNSSNSSGYGYTSDQIGFSVAYSY